MRIPQELKDALDAASAENKRSLTAEVVARLEGSFQSPRTRETAAEAIAQFLAAAQHESAQLSLRADMLKLKYEALMARITAVSAQADLLARTAKTDEDFAKAEAKAAEIDDEVTESAGLRAELESLLTRRMHTLETIQNLQLAVAQKASDLEDALSQAKSKKTANH